MKTPSLEEVKAYFKDAKLVKSIYGSKFILNDLSLIGFSNLDCADGIYYNDGEYKIYDTETKTYAEIISYKDKTNESAKKNPEVKQYKHVPTGKIVESSEIEGFYAIDGIALPNWLIENSSDWEEVIPNPVLFLTEDGVEIRQGDKHYGVYTNSWQIEENTIDCVLSKNELYQDEFYKTFSTRELASEYVLRNKPCLSVNDVVYGTKKAFVNNEAMSALVELAKSKISDQQ